MVIKTKLPNNNLAYKTRDHLKILGIIFDKVFSWAKSYVKNMSSKNLKEIPPLQLFITGGAGTGKSHLIKTIHAALTKTFSYGSPNVDKSSVLLLAPTGVAAININENTIYQL